tara:strand:- start:318 stop:1178 length:861 start_codon:yes stop_codon:yes gene_type:complete
MKKLMLAFIMFFMMTTIGWSQSNVYIDQQDSGTGLDIDIYIDGAGSVVGEASGGSNDEEFQVGGNGNNIDIDLIGANIKVYGEWLNTSGNGSTADLTINNNGASNVTKVNVGEGTATVDVTLNQDVDGASNEISYFIGKSTYTCTPGSTASSGTGADTTCASGTAATAAVEDLAIDVNVDTDSNYVDIHNIGTYSSATTTDIDIAGGTGNNIDSYTIGSGAHNTTINVNGASNTVLTNQHGSAATTFTLDLDASSANINSHQGDVASTVNLDVNGASADVDIVIEP